MSENASKTPQDEEFKGTERTSQMLAVDNVPGEPTDTDCLRGQDRPTDIKVDENIEQEPETEMEHFYNILDSVDDSEDYHSRETHNSDSKNSKAQTNANTNCNDVPLESQPARENSRLPQSLDHPAASVLPKVHPVDLKWQNDIVPEQREPDVLS